jgi:hypothetical protein
MMQNLLEQLTSFICKEVDISRDWLNQEGWDTWDMQHALDKQEMVRNVGRTSQRCFGDPDAYGKIILKWLLKEYGPATGFSEYNC